MPGSTDEIVPLPCNRSVTMREVERREIASIRFKGISFNNSAKTKSARLEDWLRAQGLEHQGDWRIAIFDPPFTIPWFRPNEVLVTLR